MRASPRLLAALAALAAALAAALGLALALAACTPTTSSPSPPSSADASASAPEPGTAAASRMTAVLNDPAYAARVEVVASTGRTGSPQAEFHERFDLVGDAWRRSIEFAGRPDTPARDTVYLAGETMDRTSAEVWTLRGESDPETIGVAAFLVELAAAFAESAPRTIDGEALDHLAAPVPRPLAVALLDGLVPANRLPDDLEANADAFLDPDGAPVLLELNVSWLQTQPGVPGTAYELKASYRFESGEVGEITRPASVWARFASDQFSYGAIRRDGRPSRRAARSRRIS